MDDSKCVEDPNGQIDFDKVLMKQREFNAIIKKAQEKQGSSQSMYNELERNMSLRLMTLNEVEGTKHSDELKSDPVKDAQVFREVCSKTFNDFKQQHRSIVGEIRTREHDTISRLGSERPPDVESTHGYTVDAYDRISQQVNLMKQKIMKSKQEHEDFREDDFRAEQSADKKAMTFRDFYKAKPFDNDNDDSDDSFYSGSRSDEDEADDYANPVDDGATRHLKKGKKELYESQLRKAQANRQTTNNMNSTARLDLTRSEVSTPGGL